MFENALARELSERGRRFHWGNHTMKKTVSLVTAAAFAASLSTVAFANGQGTPIEPAPTPAPLEPAGPAPAATVEEASSSQNWWLIALAAAIAIGIIIAVSDNNDDSNDQPID